MDSEKYFILLLPVLFVIFSRTIFFLFPSFFIIFFVHPLLRPSSYFFHLYHLLIFILILTSSFTSSSSFSFFSSFSPIMLFLDLSIFIAIHITFFAPPCSSSTPNISPFPFFSFHLSIRSLFSLPLQSDMDVALSY